jgi:hypothetical protein
MGQTREWARLADLIVLRPPASEDRFGRKFAENLLRAGAPCLLVPEATSQSTRFDRIVIAWDGSPEAHHALDRALALLCEAQAILAVAVGIRTDAEETKVCDALRTYLSHHQIHAEIHASATPIVWRTRLRIAAGPSEQTCWSWAPTGAARSSKQSSAASPTKSYGIAGDRRFWSIERVCGRRARVGVDAVSSIMISIPFCRGGLSLKLARTVNRMTR